MIYEENIKILFFVVFIISCGMFFVILKNNKKNKEGLIATGGVALVLLIGIIISYFI